MGTRREKEMLIVTRHKGAVEWLRRQGIEGDVRDHITLEDIQGMKPTIIVGVLPLHLAVAAIQLGHRFVSLQLDLPRELRSKELASEDVQKYGELLELQLEWIRVGMDAWQKDVPECRTGVPEASGGDCQKFRIGLVPREPWELQPVMWASPREPFTEEDYAV